VQVELRRINTIYTVRLISSGREPTFDLDTEQRFHLFLSHYWNSAQDQVALIKRQLQILIPQAQAFLECAHGPPTHRVPVAAPGRTLRRARTHDPPHAP
jgi:hypothetical protein